MGFLDHGPALLFCPGDRPDRYAKAAAAADAVLLDLEDAVAPDAKERARSEVANAVPELGDRVVVRVNAIGTPWHEADVAAMRRAGARQLMLPKATGPEDLAALGDFEVVALCESAAGVLNARALAHSPHCAALFWGGEDLIADLGGRFARDAHGRYHPVVEQARSTVLLAAGEAGRPAIDTVHIAIGDLAGVGEESVRAADSGFRAKACIHPSHVPAIRAGFAPTEEQATWARDVLAAAGREAGVFVFRGRMIDAPLLAQARAIAGHSAAPTTHEGQ
ncbi:HpcH/HpaI aldolase/citrate lyase family protein [Streptomyces iconiensis]|uniref:CoA ester lyase n=1 Tax=Streptomyces iconiensis TaxID=1384038 RepID=A0ABT7A6K7_9ACTN|nr:CoA ester lyase [Streptomyces iconiensis]MDJ1136972.1 CoA ester lyase [Streptomyces iconiensis]